MDRLAAISAATDLDQFRNLVDDLDFFVTNHSSTFITDVIDDCDWYRDYMSYTWGDGMFYLFAYFIYFMHSIAFIVIY